MTDLISRQDAIALLNAEKVNAAETKDATDEAYNMAIVHCIEALTNMPSEALREGDNLYIGRPQPEPPLTVTLDLDKLP